MTLSLRLLCGQVREISAEDYVEQVNRAGDGIWVVLHLYKQGYVAGAVVQYRMGTATRVEGTGPVRS